MRLSRIAKYAGLILGGGSILLFFWASAFPNFTEIAYGNMAFPAIRWLLDHTFGIVPFPLVYLFPIFVGLLFWKVALQGKTKWAIALGLGNFVGILIALFYLLWGFNYARPNLTDRLPYTPNEITDSQLLLLASHTVNSLNELRTPELLSQFPSKSVAEKELRPALEHVLSKYNINLRTRSTVRGLWPAGVLRKLGISGIYFPYTGEALVEAAQPQPEKLFVMAHELAHSYGVTDEGDANLVAYLACAHLPQATYRYAAHLAMWEYTSGTLKKRDPEARSSLENNLSEPVKADLEMLKQERRRYGEWIPNLGNFVNDTYLKAQGLEMGSAAYNTLPGRYLQHTQTDLD